MASGGSKSLCGEEIRNILVEYEGQIRSDSKIDGEFDTSDSGSSHIDDIALGEAIVSEIDIEAEEERTEGFWWENMDNCVKQREAFYDVSGPQNNAKEVRDIAGCFELCIGQHDTKTLRTSFSEKSATNRKKIKTTEKMCCVYKSQ
jgi:hypothetical protein